MENRRLQSADELLHSAADAVALSASSNLWEDLASCLGLALRVDWVVVGQLLSSETPKTRTLAAWHGGKAVRDFEYEVEREKVNDLQRKRLWLYPSGARKHLRSAWLEEAHAESYGEVTLIDSLGQPRGILAIAHSQPFNDVTHVEWMLRIIAFKAAVELERELADNHLYRELL